MKLLRKQLFILKRSIPAIVKLRISKEALTLQEMLDIVELADGPAHDRYKRLAELVTYRITDIKGDPITKLPAYLPYGAREKSLKRNPGHNKRVKELIASTTPVPHMFGPEPEQKERLYKTPLGLYLGDGVFLDRKGAPQVSISIGGKTGYLLEKSEQKAVVDRQGNPFSFSYIKTGEDGKPETVELHISDISVEGKYCFLFSRDKRAFNGGYWCPIEIGSFLSQGGGQEFRLERIHDQEVIDYLRGHSYSDEAYKAVAIEK